MSVVYITDNPEIKKEIAGSVLSYQLYNWKASVDDEDAIIPVKFTKTWKSRNVKAVLNERSVNSVSAIVAPSNYRLIYDLIVFSEETGKRVRFYSWNGWPKRKFIPDREKIRSEFEKYLQRGYISRAHYFELGKWNMNRIEQFIITLAASAFESGIVKREKITPKKLQVLSAITAISESESVSVGAAIERIIYNYRKRNISDPFLNGKFTFIKDSKLKKIMESYSEKITDFHLLVKMLLPIMPLVDILKTVAFLEKNGYISFSPNFFSVKTDISKEHIQIYKDYLSPKKWKEIYFTGTFSFSGILPAISEERPFFKCPVCSAIKFRTSLLWFRCANPSCGFKIKRTINPLGAAMRLKTEDFKKLVQHGSVMIKNKNGGYSRYLLKKNEKSGKYYIYPELRSG